MKKFALSMIAALAIFSVSCSKSGGEGDSANGAAKSEKVVAEGDVKAQLIQLCNETAAAIEANPADAEKIFQSFNEKGEALTKGLDEADAKEYMQDEEFMQAMTAVQQAMMKVAMSQAENAENAEKAE